VSASPNRLIERPPHSPVSGVYLTTAQQLAFERLKELTALNDSGTYGGFKPRIRGLLIGASGSGKTAVVRRTCEHLRLPLLSCNAGSWIVHGAATNPHTLEVCRQFVAKHEEGVIFLDELDKGLPCGANVRAHAWCQAVFGEVIALLDADERLLSLGWEAQDLHRLQRRFSIHAAGAWQHAVMAIKARRKQGSLGFSTRNDHHAPSYRELVREDDAVPPEIFFRFHPDPIFISAVTKADFREAIRRVHADLWIEGDVPEDLVEQASESGIGVRWIEGYVTDLLLRRPELRRGRPKDEKPVRKQKPRKMSQLEYAKLEAKLAIWTIEARQSLCRLRAQRGASQAAMAKYPCLTVLFEGDRKSDECIYSLTAALSEALSPMEVGQGWSPYTVELIERLITLVQVALKEHAVALDALGLLTRFADQYELLDRMCLTVQSLPGISIEEA
jgi:hypothetical protein